MATKKQISANRKNSRKSSGPKSSLGKMISSRNSTRHGFYATSVLLPDEDRDEFLRFARRLATAYSPCDVIEEEQVRTIIETRWQMRRANVIDTELFQMYRLYDGEQRGVGTAFAHDASQANSFSKLVRYHSFLMRKLSVAEKELACLKGVSNQQRSLSCQTTLVRGNQPQIGISTLALEAKANGPATIQAATGPSPDMRPGTDHTTKFRQAPPIMKMNTPANSKLKPVNSQPRREWRIPRIDDYERLIEHQKEEARLRELAEGTTPEGREILRKIMFGIERLLKEENRTREEIVAIIKAEFTMYQALQPEFLLLLSRLWGVSYEKLCKIRPRAIARLMLHRIELEQQYRRAKEQNALPEQ